MDFTRMYDENGNPVIYTITLANGVQITDLRLNGNNFVSQDLLTKADFEDNLSTVTISDGERTVTYEHMRLIQIAHYSDGYYFILQPISKEELDKMKWQADIEYIAMMAGVDLDE